MRAHRDWLQRIRERLLYQFKILSKAYEALPNVVRLHVFEQPPSFVDQPATSCNTKRTCTTWLNALTTCKRALRPQTDIPVYILKIEVELFTLTGVCIDWYEIFTRMSEQKILKKQRAGNLVVASWLIAATSSLLAGYGYIQNALQHEIYCEMSPHFVKGLESKHKGVSNIWVITDVSVWITACNIIDVYTLWAVCKVLVLHIAAVRSTLGAQETVQEIKVVKLAVYVCG